MTPSDVPPPPKGDAGAFGLSLEHRVVLYAAASVAAMVLMFIVPYPHWLTAILAWVGFSLLCANCVLRMLEARGPSSGIPPSPNKE